MLIIINNYTLLQTPQFLSLWEDTRSDSCKIRYNVSRSNSIGSVQQLFSAFVTMQLPQRRRLKPADDCATPIRATELAT